MLKKILLLTLLVPTLAISQIPKIHIKEVKEDPTTTQYDSLTNFLETNPYPYINQKLQVVGVTEGLRKYAYEDFTSDPNKKWDPLIKINYEELVDRTFLVLNVEKHPKAETKEYLYKDTYCLTLKDIDNEDIIYFQYHGKYEHTFPFITLGYYEKKRKLFLNNKFVSRGLYWSFDINGNEIHDSAGDIWTCVDLAIDDKFYDFSLVLENNKGNKVSVPIKHIENTNTIMFNKKDADRYRKKFGETNWNKILKEEVAIGFTEEMARLSWGEPIKINSSSYLDQWVYNNNYLYFKNGKLTDWN